METLRFPNKPAASFFLRWKPALGGFYALGAERRELKEIQFWVKSSARQYQFSHGRPITVEEGWDKYHNNQPAHISSITATKALG